MYSKSMYSKRWKAIHTITILFCILLCCSCSSSEQAELQTRIAVAAETAIAEANTIAATQGAQFRQTAESKLATEVASAAATLEAIKNQNSIILRAQIWANAKVPYGSFDEDPENDYFDGYRADCSGFVSYTWQLPEPGPDTTSFDNYITNISIEELQKGDALNNRLSGGAGHMVLFVEWLNTEHTLFKAYDLNTYPGYVSEKTFTLEPLDNGWTIKELEQWAIGPYYAQRLSASP